jgi:beta-galactosidase
MKRNYLSLVSLLLLATATNAQIQKLSYQTANNQTININRVSPALYLQSDKISLDGTWKFSTDVANLPCDKNIQVPGEWVMQGFEVKPFTAAGYQKNFSLPTTWKDKRIKLRFDAVYSDAEIWLNGKKTAAHLGGFTPFEVDITDFAKLNGENDLLIKVKSESKADSLASASQYAVHPLGGIPRKVYVVAVPDLNFAYADATTTFDAKYQDATLTSTVIVANEMSGKSGSFSIKAELYKADGKTLVTQNTIEATSVTKGDFLQQQISLNVASPAKWDPEHPNLYVLKWSILQNGNTISSITKNIGFRQIEVRGNRVYVNNMPVKLRGVCHHETMPLRGRSVAENMWEKDVALFREGNVNYMRTSHYPPAEELIDACNRLGMFLEVEAPFCWAENTTVPEELKQPLLVDQTIDMVNFFRTNPSVLIWSIGNESGKYPEYFKSTAKLVKEFDASRPRNFSQYGPDADEGDLEITNHHYPGPTGPSKYAKYKRPIVFDEYVHLNAYNRLELVTDPGLRDAWGIGFEKMWEEMWRADGVLGGAIWAGIDDTFFLPNGKTVGYGTWGPLDGWRRPKPEYWHMKKIYSPVKITQLSNWENGKISLTIENRLQFSNLNECKIDWSVGGKSGIINAVAKAGARITVPVELSLQPAYGEKLTINVRDPRGLLIDTYQFQIMPKLTTPVTASTATPLIYSQSGNVITAKNKNVSISFNQATGDLSQISSNGATVLQNGIRLMVLRLTGEGRGVQMTGDTQFFDAFTAVCQNRVVQSVKTEKGKNEFVVVVKDDYDEAYGTVNYRIANNGVLTVDYKYTLKKEINPRQWGMVFNLPKSFDKLSWNRKGLWNYYPEDHIGRLTGTASALSAEKAVGAAGPEKPTAQAWGLDRTVNGTNDFRSTKMYINNAKLIAGTKTFEVKSTGSQSFRAWQEGSATKALVAGYSNMGAERFFRGHAALMDKPLKVGDVIQDTISIKL